MRVKFPLALNLLGLCDKFHILHVTTEKYLVSENIPFSTTTLLIMLILAFFFFFAKIVPLLKTTV